MRSARPGSAFSLDGIASFALDPHIGSFLLVRSYQGDPRRSETRRGRRTSDALWGRVAAAWRGVLPSGRDRRGCPALRRLIARLLEIRRGVLQLDVLTFGPEGTTVVATNEPNVRLPFSRRDAEEVQNGRVVSRAVTTEAGHHWEVMAPITLAGVVAGAGGAEFSR